MEGLFLKRKFFAENFLISRHTLWVWVDTHLKINTLMTNVIDEIYH